MKSAFSKPRRRGGWKSSTSIPWRVVKDIHALGHHERFNTVVHIMPDQGDDRERKRFISRFIARLGQVLKRNGEPHTGVTIYEKRDDVDLHAHHLCRVCYRLRWVIARLANGSLIMIEFFRSNELDRWLAYCTKQRASLPPELEAKVHRNHPRQKSVPIRGVRVSFTSSARDALTGIAEAENAARKESRSALSKPRRSKTWG